MELINLLFSLLYVTAENKFRHLSEFEQNYTGLLMYSSNKRWININIAYICVYKS
jgi:hypothetical protein